MQQTSDVGYGARMNRSRVWSVAGAVAIAALLLQAAPVAQSAGSIGQWLTLPYLLPTNLNPVHVALMKNGKVLIIAGSGNVPTNSDYESGVWDPQTGTLVQQPIAWDMFCNNMSVLPDGRVLINGGTLQYDPFYGE